MKFHYEIAFETAIEHHLISAVVTGKIDVRKEVA